MPTTIDEEKLGVDLHELLFGVRRSILYHNRRRGFYDRFDKITKVLSVIGGSAALAAIVGSQSITAGILAAVVAIVSAISLVVGPAEEARLHSELARRFAILEREMVTAPISDFSKLTDFRTERLMIEIDEPPKLRVLDTICHNELCKAMGYDEKSDICKMGWVQSLFAQVVDLWPSKIKRERET